jgi:hypothetical protein
MPKLPSLKREGNDFQCAKTIAYPGELFCVVASRARLSPMRMSDGGLTIREDEG